MLRILRDKGLRIVSPKVFSDTADLLYASQGGERCGRTLRNVLTKAGAALPSNLLRGDHRATSLIESGAR